MIQDVHPSRTPEYRKAYAAQHYRAHKAEYLARNRSKRLRLRARLQALKSVPCQDCRRSYPPYVMDFDHREAASKRYEMTGLVYRGSLKLAMEEVAKCDVVCANCHRIRTHARRPRSSAG